MSASLNPIFVATGPTTGNGYARLTMANTTVGITAGASGQIAKLYTAGPNGSRIDEIRCHNSGMTVSGTEMSSQVFRLYLYDGTNFSLFDENILTAVQRTSSVAGPYLSFTYPGGLLLGTGWSIWVGQSVYAGTQDQSDVNVRGGDF